MKRKVIRSTIATLMCLGALALFALPANAYPDSPLGPANCSAVLTGTAPTTAQVTTAYGSGNYTTGTGILPQVQFSADCTSLNTSTISVDFFYLDSGVIYFMSCGAGGAVGTTTHTFTYTGTGGGSSGSGIDKCFAPYVFTITTYGTGGSAFLGTGNHYNPSLDTGTGQLDNLQTYTSSQNYNAGTLVVPGAFGTYNGYPACTLISIAGYKTGLPADGNTSYHYTLTFTGQVGAILAIDPNMNNASDGTTTDSGATTNGFATFIGGPLYTIAFAGSALITSTGPPYGTNSAPITIVDYSSHGGATIDPHFYCDSTPLTSGGTWTDWGLASAMSTTLTGGAGSVPCTLASLTGFNANMGDGTTPYDFSVAHGGGADYIVAVDNAATGGSPVTVDGKTWSAGNQVLAIHKDPPDPTHFSLVFASGDGVNPDFWCDFGGQWTNWGLSSVTPGTVPPGGGAYQGCGDGGAFCLGTCWTMSTWDPLKGAFWGDLVAIPICGGRWLFEPFTCSPVVNISNCLNTNALVAGIKQRIPFGYLADAGAAVGTLTSALTTSISTGACTPPTLDPFGGASTGYLHSLVGTLVLKMPEPGDLCGSSTSENVHLGELFGTRVWLRDLEALAISMTFLLALWKMMPWSTANDGMEWYTTPVGTVSGGLHSAGWSDMDIDRAADPDRPEA